MASMSSKVRAFLGGATLVALDLAVPTELALLALFSGCAMVESWNLTVSLASLVSAAATICFMTCARLSPALRERSRTGRTGVAALEDATLTGLVDATLTGLVPGLLEPISNCSGG